ncbi:MAG: hypothetical protein O7F73_03890 [Gammaproteobacteria bacterium]|nr:hypothetical protein [Gammaproteobacteria bacterium]
MSKLLQGCIEQVLLQDDAMPGDQYTDDSGNTWTVHEDREGLRLEFHEEPNVWIPYWTAMHIKLPGLHRTKLAPREEEEEEEEEEG